MILLLQLFISTAAFLLFILLKTQNVSHLEIAFVEGQSRVISSKSIQPLKILHPATSESTAHIVLSNYGGGFVAGDVVSLNLIAHKNAKFFVSSQSNTRIFKSGNDLTTEQFIRGTLDEGATGVVFPDPLVPHSYSRSFQKQEWHLKSGSLLYVSDWFSSGRSEQGEEFLFDEYSSHLSFYYNNHLKLVDSFNHSPKEYPSRSTAIFSKYNYFLNTYLIGEEHDPRFQTLKKFLLSCNPVKESAIENKELGDLPLIIASDAVREGIVITRIFAIKRIDMLEFIKNLATVFQPLLGFDFAERKF